MRTLIALTALLMGIPAFGSWDTNSWPSTNSFWIPVTTNYLAATNYWAKEHVDVWTQTSTTNYIPELTNDISGYLGPIGGYTNSGSRTWTNIYWTDIQADVPTNTTAGWYGTNQVTNVYTFIVTVDTNTLTNTLTTTVLSITAPTNIEWNLDVQWIWGFDSYIAINERLDILGDAITYTPKLYKDQSTNLVEWKTVVESMIPDFVDTTLFTNGGVITNEFLTVTGLLENISAPTNYFDYTPYRDLGGWQPGLSNVVDGVWEFPVWTTNTTTITNSITDACGSNYTYTLLGSTNTNGVVISVDFELFSGTNSLATYTATNSTEVYTNAFTCTNDFIASGFTERDYGFKWVPDIMDQLVMIKDSSSLPSPSMTLSVTQHVEYEGISSASFAAMQAIAATNAKYRSLLSFYPIQKYTRAAYDGTDWFTGVEGQTRFNRFYLSHTGVITNYDRKILFAYQTGSSGIGFPTAETNIFNDTDGIGFVENSYTYVTNSQFPSFEISAGVATSVVQSVGDTSLSSADYGTDPSTLWSSGFYRVFYGWRMKNINRYIRFDTGTNGFQYINAP